MSSTTQWVESEENQEMINIINTKHDDPSNKASLEEWERQETDDIL